MSSYSGSPLALFWHVECLLTGLLRSVFYPINEEKEWHVYLGFESEYHFRILCGIKLYSGDQESRIKKIEVILYV